MDLTLSPEEEAFRDELRAWIADNHPGEEPEGDEAAFEFRRGWQRRLSADRWAGVSWPEEYGGRDAGALEWLVFEEEYWRAGAPGRVSQNGIFLLAPTLFEHANAEQLARIMPRMARADDIWAQAWSEPESGSDLASLRSTARRVDGGWVLNGQKTWSSRATFADWGFGLLRDRHVPLFGIFGVFASAAVVSIVLVLLIRPRYVEAVAAHGVA